MTSRWLPYAFAGLCSSSHAVQYHVVELGTLNSKTAYAWAVNSSGTTVGSVGGDLFLDARPYFWTPQGGQQYLWFRASARTYGAPRDLNEAGLMVGEIQTWVPRLNRYAPRAFTWTPQGLFRTLPDIANTSQSHARAVNNLGHVAGYFVVGEEPTYKSFLWRGGNAYVLIDPILPQGDTRATDVNDSDEVVGNAAGFHDGEFVSEGWYWSAGTGRIDLGWRPGFQQSEVMAINNYGTVVVRDRQFLYDELAYWTPSGGRVVIGGYGGVITVAKDVNNLGQIVGMADPLGLSVAFLYEPGKGFQDMNSLLDLESRAGGWNLEQATSISDNGWICGFGSKNGKQRAFVAYPVGN